MNLSLYRLNVYLADELSTFQGCNGFCTPSGVCSCERAFLLVLPPMILSWPACCLTHTESWVYLCGLPGVFKISYCLPVGGMPIDTSAPISQFVFYIC